MPEKRYTGGETTIIFIQSIKHQPYLAHLHSILVNHGFVQVDIKTTVIYNKQQDKQYSFGGRLGSGFQLTTHAFVKDEADLFASPCV